VTEIACLLDFGIEQDTVLPRVALGKGFQGNEEKGLSVRGTGFHGYGPSEYEAENEAIQWKHAEQRLSMESSRRSSDD